MLRMRSAKHPRPAARGLRTADVLLSVAVLGVFILVGARLDRVDRREISGVATVIDGDTITLGAERIRLLGLDAPEFGQTCTRLGSDYACGREARDALADLIGGGQVRCAGWERDRYGRLLAACSAGGIAINRQLVAIGWAVGYGDFEAEEKAARERGAGLWAGPFKRPRDWREQHGSLAESAHTSVNRIVNWLRQMVRFW